MPRPGNDVASSAPAASASSSIAACAPDATPPRPAMMIGRLAPAILSTSIATVSGLGNVRPGCGMYDADGLYSGPPDHVAFCKS